MSRGLRVRTRLALLYAALFLFGGALLVAGMVWSVRDSLFADPPVSASSAQEQQRVIEMGKLNYIEEVRVELRENVMRRLAWNAGAGLLALTILSAAVGAVTSGRTLGRVRRVAEAAREASETSLHRRLNLPGPRDEIKNLGDTFDAMLARLDEAFEAQRRFVANASHELRTPLAVTRTAVEVTLAKTNATPAQLRAMGEEVCAAMVRAQRLVEALLLLSRSEQRLGATDADDLADLAGEALDMARAQIVQRRLSVQSVLEAAPVCGDPALLAQAVANLVENAVRYNDDGGHIRVTTGADGTDAYVQVASSGPDMSAVDTSRLFEPFNRGEQTRLDGDGVGLGLSIVRAVAVAHGGQVTAHARPPGDGGGLTIVLRLPSHGNRRADPAGSPGRGQRGASDPAGLRRTRTGR